MNKKSELLKIIQKFVGQDLDRLTKLRNLALSFPRECPQKKAADELHREILNIQDKIRAAHRTGQDTAALEAEEKKLREELSFVIRAIDRGQAKIKADVSKLASEISKKITDALQPALDEVTDQIFTHVADGLNLWAQWMLLLDNLRDDGIPINLEKLKPVLNENELLEATGVNIKSVIGHNPRAGVEKPARWGGPIKPKTKLKKQLARGKMPR